MRLRTGGALVCVAGLAVALALAGCAPRPGAPKATDASVPASGAPATSVSPTAMTSPAVTASPVVTTSPVVTASQPSPYTPRPMPWPGGGDTLWPTETISGTAADWPAAQTVYRGFIDAQGRVVVPPIYVDVSACINGGRPTSFLGLREGAVDVLGLDGHVATTIPVTYSGPPDGSPLAGLWAISCDRRTAILQIGSGPDAWTYVRYDLTTGAKLGTTSEDPRPTCPDSTAPAIPDDYSRWDGGRWASSGATTGAHINLDTGAIVDPPLRDCLGSGDYLVCEGGVLPFVYDRTGALTAFGSAARPLAFSAGCAMAALPYYWVTAGPVQGYVDAAGTWYYQESRYQALAG